MSTTTTVLTDDQQSLIDGLRSFAEFLETKPQFCGALRWATLLLPVSDADEFRALASDLGGRREKDAGERYFGVARQFGGIELKVYIERDKVCERVAVGTRSVQRDVVVDTETVEEPVYEWRCEPVLAEVVDQAHALVQEADDRWPAA